MYSKTNKGRSVQKGQECVGSKMVIIFLFQTDTC